MNILRTLIAKEWFRIFFYACATFFIIISIAELVAGLLRSSVTAKDVLVNYLLSIPSHLTKVFPIACLVSSLFSINKLRSKNELLAIFAAGFPRKTFLLTIFQTSLIVAGIQFITTGYFVPFSKQIRKKVLPESGRKFKKTKSKGLVSSALESGKIWYKSQNFYISFEAYDKSKKKLIKPSIYYFNSNYNTYKIINSEFATFLDDKWSFEKGKTLNNLDSGEFPNSTFFDTKSIELEISPEDLKKIDSDITALGLFALLKFINRVKLSGINTTEFEIIFLDKIASTVICIIFSLHASISVFNPNRRSSSFGKNVLYTFIFVILFWLFYSSMLAVGSSGKVHPIIAAFTTPLLFLLHFLYVMHKNKKIS